MKTRVLISSFIFLMICSVLSASVSAAAVGGDNRSRIDLVVPEALNIGDKVGIVAPASRATPDRLELASDFLTDMGFEVVIADNIDLDTEFGVGDGSEQVRAEAFNALARDPEIKEIFCLRGGYGAMHLLQNIDYEALRRNRPIIIGYSDITALHTAIVQNAGLVTFHGPMLSSNYGQQEAFDLLFEMLMAPKAAFPLENIDGTAFITINEGYAEGIIVGGNMTLLSSLMGTEYELDVKDKILFIEETGEAPYRLHRYIWQLKLAGLLDEVAAVVIGDILPDRVYDDPEISLKVILEALKDVNVPILYNVRAGHGVNPLTIPIGAMVRIEGNGITVMQEVVTGAEATSDGVITRAEFTALMMEALEGKMEYIRAAEPFDDVPDSSPYYTHVISARAMGVTSGVGNNRFMPHAAMTYQDMLVMIHSALSRLGRLPDFQTDQWIEFDDWDGVAEYARGPIQTLAKMYTFGGVLNPGKPVPRAEAVIILAALISD